MSRTLLPSSRSGIPILWSAATFPARPGVTIPCPRSIVCHHLMRPTSSIRFDVALFKTGGNATHPILIVVTLHAESEVPSENAVIGRQLCRAWQRKALGAILGGRSPVRTPGVLLRATAQVIGTNEEKGNPNTDGQNCKEETR